MPSPGGLAAVGIYRRLAWTRLARGRLRWVVLALLALPVVGTGALALGGAKGQDLLTNMLEVYFRFLVLFLPALTASQIVAEEIEGKTFTFLFARPAPRWAMPLGKYLATVAPLVALFAVSASLCCAIAMLPPDVSASDRVDMLGILGRALAALTLGVLTFGAMTALIGAWFTGHPFIAVMGYLLVVEGLLASLPTIFSVAAMSWHLRNLAGLTGTAASDSVFAEAHLAPWASAAVLAGVTVLALLLAAVSVSDAEYRTDR
jgi:ABC-type transport system involved in multi-copper enzyme maturation permease subunit